MQKLFETQQTRARKEFKALDRAEKNSITDAELVQEMTKDMADPESAQSIMQAAAALMYMRGVKGGETPITEATNRCLARKRKDSKAASNLTPKSV
ncbi:hypothetical protein [Pelagibaculum spongiae]|uniref:Uncharacterized protein n=1 Tax=Pelagibaculum spongiae TaxID=2080658 RepID=A0A2V1GPD5_9GAMM|nr:hypothetical protein [Pelagibaculum spongiae]PVZ64387.1 hypothetical protein DC094_20230 [Pelagibaculum spongiae]